MTDLEPPWVEIGVVQKQLVKLTAKWPATFLITTSRFNWWLHKFFKVGGQLIRTPNQYHAKKSPFTSLQTYKITES
jgi:hypothetical protein